MASENGVPAESFRFVGNRRAKDIVIRIVVDDYDSGQCGEECEWNQIGSWECKFFRQRLFKGNRCPQCIKEFGE